MIAKIATSIKNYAYEIVVTILVFAFLWILLANFASTIFDQLYVENSDQFEFGNFSWGKFLQDLWRIDFGEPSFGTWMRRLFLGAAVGVVFSVLATATKRFLIALPIFVGIFAIAVDYAIYLLFRNSEPDTTTFVQVKMIISMFMFPTVWCWLMVFPFWYNRKNDTSNSNT